MHALVNCTCNFDHLGYLTRHLNCCLEEISLPKSIRAQLLQLRLGVSAHGLGALHSFCVKSVLTARILRGDSPIALVA